MLKTGLKLNPKKLYGADGYAVKATGGDPAVIRRSPDPDFHSSGLAGTAPPGTGVVRGRIGSRLRFSAILESDMSHAALVFVRILPLLAPPTLPAVSFLSMIADLIGLDIPSVSRSSANLTGSSLGYVARHRDLFRKCLQKGAAKTSP